jgi:hypothetical protein
MSLIAFALASQIVISLGPAQQAALVGEPVAFTVTWRTQRGVVDEFIEDGTFRSSSPLTFVVTDENGQQRRYRESGVNEGSIIVKSKSFSAARPQMVDMLLVHGFSEPDGWGPLSLHPGQYDVRAEHRLSDGAIVLSNPVRVTVNMPTGSEADVLKALAADWKLFDDPDALTTRELLSRHPGSAYLNVIRLQQIKKAILDLANEYDRERGAWLTTLAPADAAVRKREIVESLLREIGSRRWNALEPQALVLGREMARMLRDEAAADEFTAALLKRHGDTAVAKEVEKGGSGE